MGKREWLGLGSRGDISPALQMVSVVVIAKFAMALFAVYIASSSAHTSCIEMLNDIALSSFNVINDWLRCSLALHLRVSMLGLMSVVKFLNWV